MKRKERLKQLQNKVSAVFHPYGIGKFIYEDEDTSETAEIPFTWEYVSEE